MILEDAKREVPAKKWRPLIKKARKVREGLLDTHAEMDWFDWKTSGLDDRYRRLSALLYFYDNRQRDRSLFRQIVKFLEEVENEHRSVD